MYITQGECLFFNITRDEDLSGHNFTICNPVEIDHNVESSHYHYTRDAVRTLLSPNNVTLFKFQQSVL